MLRYFKMKFRLADIIQPCIFCYLALCSISLANADTLIAENGPSDGLNTIPFGTTHSEIRYHQVYTSSLFTEEVSITSIAFSPSFAVDYSAAHIEFRFTTTSTAVGELSTNLDNNYITPLTTVFMEDSYTQSIVTTGTESFSFVFDFSASPFLYDPTTGNLLMDILITGQSPSGYLAFSQSVGGSGTYSRAYSRNGNTGSDLAGLRTKFEYTVVPVPAAVWLFGSGLIGLIGVARRKANA